MTRSFTIPAESDLADIPPTSYDVDFNCDIDTQIYEFDRESGLVRSVDIFTDWTAQSGIRECVSDWWPVADLVEFEDNALYRASIGEFECYVRVHPDGLEFTSLTRKS